MFSSCSSLASRSISSSSTSSPISSSLASGRSILLTTTIILSPISSALESTKRVCGIGPSAASTSSRAPSTMLKTRSTSPPKSACPGVSMILILVSPYRTEVFFAKMVMPRSRSRSLESITRSATAWFSRKTPPCFSISSTNVVFPWSTCAIMATFLKSVRIIFLISFFLSVD